MTAEIEEKSFHNRGVREIKTYQQMAVLGIAVIIRGLQPPEEAAPAIALADDARRLQQALRITNPKILRRAARLQQRLDHVERRRQPRREPAGQPSRDAVRQRVVRARRVHDLGDGLVGHELQGGEGDGHAQRRRVGDIEGLQALGLEDLARALEHGPVQGAVDLHPLFYNYRRR